MSGDGQPFHSTAPSHPAAAAPTPDYSSSANSPTPTHALAAEEVLAEQQVSAAQGLSTLEAQSRFARFGPNALPETQSIPLWKLFAAQFRSPLIYLLLIAAALALALGKAGDASVIFLVVVVNSFIGTIQEGRANRSMESLRRLSALKVRVLRESAEHLLEAQALVPGDLLLLSAGDAIGADARLLDCAALEVAEGALTGESLPVRKSSDPLPTDTLLADRTNMVYSGTHVTAGRGRAVVVSTGTQTEVGQIAQLTQTAGELSTPLEQRLQRFSRYLVIAAVLLFVAVMGVGKLRGLPSAEIFMVAISQMVSLVPEGLPVAMTIALAVGMQRMAKRGAIVRRLSAVETLGSTSVICTDKTGTLTKNEMTVTSLWLPDQRVIEVGGIGYAPAGKLLTRGQEILTPDQDANLRPLLEAITLCNDARLLAPGDGELHWRALGDPTEAALLTLARKACVDPETLHHRWPRRAEIPFDSGAKLMATQHGHPHQPNRIFIKGAPEILLELCSSAQLAQGPASLPLSLRQQTLVTNEALASQALRVLAIAECDGQIDQASDFQQFRGRARFLGLIGQMDPPRAEAKSAVEQCQSAGIRPIMVTGDHKATGLAIARMLGIAQENHRAIDGRQLAALSDSQLEAELPQIAVFARVHPEQKLRIVSALQAQGQVVAMSGDGVNDAPALARADVGVAMGITGTEVAKGAAKIVITDDNFATIVRAIEQGRLVYSNIQKLLVLLFATSIDEVLFLLGALLLGYPLPLAAVQILWINVVTEGTLTINLVMERPEGNEMQQPPIRLAQPLITAAMARRMVLMICSSLAATFGFFHWRLSSGDSFALVQTETFTLLAVCQWFNALNCQSATRSAWSRAIFKNPWLLGGLALANLLQFAVIYTAPLNRLFHTVPIPLADVLIIGAIASLVLWAEEVRKFFARKAIPVPAPPQSGS